MLSAFGSGPMNSTTTIEIRREVLKLLQQRRDPVIDRNWSDVIKRELQTEGSVYVKVITIDDLIADSSDHSIIFQLGQEPPQYYRYFKGKFEPLGEELPKIKVKTE